MSNSQVLITVYHAMRKLAKTNKYQLLYSQYKETGVRIFKNEHNLTDYQISFIQYLAFYTNINTDIYMDDVSDIVLEDEVYEDAYTYYKQKSGKKKRKERKKDLNKPSRKPSNTTKKETTSSTHIVFSRPKK